MVNGNFLIEVTLEISDLKFWVNFRLFKALKGAFELCDHLLFKSVVCYVYFNKCKEEGQILNRVSSNVDKS